MTPTAVRPDRIEAVLGRRRQWNHEELPLPVFSSSERILVTGSDGFLGRRLRESPAVQDLEVGAFDLVDGCDVLDETYVLDTFARFQPTIVFHLAAHKDAPEGEQIPGRVADVNVRGTQIVVDAAHRLAVNKDQAVRVVLASTCKAADPATAYGASKLIAERIVLNCGGSAVRLVNVAGSSRSVLELWDQTQDDEPIKVASHCRRAFVTPDEAVRLLLNAATLPSGVYAPRPRFLRMEEVARLAYPDRPQVRIRPRWGDRVRERLFSETEWTRQSTVPAMVHVEHEWRDGLIGHAASWCRAPLDEA